MITTVDIDKATLQLIEELDFWDLDGVLAEKTLTYIAGALDMAAKVKQKIKAQEGK